METALTATSKNVNLAKSDEIKGMISQYNILVELAKEVMVKDRDFGIIPGVQKPSLLKPGAEKLRLTFNLETKTELIREIFDLDKPYLDFTYLTSVYNPKTGKLMAQCEGNANSYEPKFRYLWMKEHEVPADKREEYQSKSTTIFEFKWAIAKKETGGKYGKPAEYWEKFEKLIKSGKAKEVKKATSKGEQPGWEITSTMYRVPNPDVVGLKNTLMKMAQKRSFVGGIMLATGASEFFTSDVEDMEIINVETGEFEIVESPVKADATEKVEKETGMKFDEGTQAEPEKPKGKGKKKSTEPDKTDEQNLFENIAKAKTHDELNALWKAEYIENSKIIDVFKNKRSILTEELINTYIDTIKAIETVENIAKIRREISGNKYIVGEPQDTLFMLLDERKSEIG